jgi:predicted DCC family thiol-disulfide oxidoreductase YuxK|tara:strand:- start:110 stop:514 length:405 start_codon:yes stop_codon:yes gene_type:complete
MKENKHIIYFDGICGLCNSFVSFLLKIDSSSNLKFATIQGESGQKLLNKMNFSNSEFDTLIFQKNDQVYTKSTAVFEIFKTIGGFFKIFLIFNLLPTSFLDSIYRYIALKRYKLFGKLEQCDISKFNKPGQFID